MGKVVDSGAAMFLGKITAEKANYAERVLDRIWKFAAIPPAAHLRNDFSSD